MRRKHRSRTVFGTLALLGLALLCAPVGAEEETEDEAAARTYAREQLTRNANLSVDPTNRESGGLDDLKQILESKRRLYEGLSREEYGHALQLLGGRGADGLIQEGARLYRWQAGIPVRVETPDGGPAKATPTAGPAEDRSKYASLYAAAADWQRLAAAAAQGGQGDDAAARWLEPKLLALVHAGELQIPISRPELDAREVALADRLKALQAEQPPRGLVNDSTVSEKAARAKALRAEVDALAADRERIVQALDRMARAERLLKEDSGRLGFEIDEARREEAARKKAEAEPADDSNAPKKGAPKNGAPKNGEPAPSAEVSPKLAKLQLEEIVDEQQLRLLYISARRASLLLQLYAEALRQKKEEALAAEDAHKRFEAELSRWRRERQLERLAGQASDLKRERSRVVEEQKAAADAVRPLWAAYASALENLAALNTLTREAVALRRGLEARIKPECAADETGAIEEGCLPPEAPDGAAPGTDEPDTPASKDPLRRFREPSKSTIDANYVRDARERVDDPAWSAELAAQHFVAVDDRIQVLEGTLTLVKDTSALRERFTAASEAADKALTEVYAAAQSQGLLSRWYTTVRKRRKENLEADRTAFRETLNGIDEERTKIREDLVLFRDYRARLLDLGTRSFQIRVQRTLDPDRLQAAYDDVDRTVNRTGRWLTLQGEEHAGTFIQRNWLMLLACVGVLVASILFVRFGRHLLDGRLRTLATRVPQLRAEPVTVRAEEAQAKREKAVQDAAAKAAEEEALRQVSKEEADRQQKMGEGGYGGGEDA
jgi:hypothetical protein